MFLDGIVVDWESMLHTSATYAGRYDQGETATHEVDRAAVAVLATAAGPPAEVLAETAPDATTDTVMAMYRHLLKRDDVTEDTNFFASGGHSLLAAQLVQRIQKQTGVRLKLSAAFAHPTPAALAELITGSTR